MNVGTLRATVSYGAWVGAIVGRARRNVRRYPRGAPQRALWAGLSRGLLDSSELPAWMVLWRPPRPIDAEIDDDFYRAGRLWGELLAVAFRKRAREGRPLQGREAEELIEACSRYTAELAFPRLGQGPLIDGRSDGVAIDELHAAGIQAVRRRGPEPDPQTQAMMRAWLEARTSARPAGAGVSTDHPGRR